MKLILAQGNPGSNYAKTRHNIGWLVLDAFASSRELGEFQPKNKFLASTIEFSHMGEKIILAKPTTFYNETGRSARAIADFYQISSDDILVVHDDLALPFGTIRVRHGGSNAGNNGIKSLNSHLGETFWRLRIGIGSTDSKNISDADFVLSRLPAPELTKLQDDLFTVIDGYITQFLNSQLSATSTSTNFA